VSFWDHLGNQHQQLLTDAFQHASAVFQCMVIATLLGILIGVVSYRSNLTGNLAITSTATILTVPSLALIGLLIPMVGLGVPPTVISLTLYGLLPIVRNSIAGLLNPLSTRLTARIAQKLNAKVDVEGEDPHKVAKDWLIQEGFIRNG
jgi:osmoprotectant transport system permease protein